MNDRRTSGLERQRKMLAHFERARPPKPLSEARLLNGLKKRGVGDERVARAPIGREAFEKSALTAQEINARTPLPADWITWVSTRSCAASVVAKSRAVWFFTDKTADTRIGLSLTATPDATYHFDFAIGEGLNPDGGPPDPATRAERFDVEFDWADVDPNVDHSWNHVLELDVVSGHVTTFLTVPTNADPAAGLSVYIRPVGKKHWSLWSCRVRRILP